MPAFLCTLVLALLSITSAWAVDLNKRVTFDIPPQEVSSALLAFAKQANVQVMSAAQNIGARRTPGVNGELTISAALTKLLDGTGLRFRTAGDGTIMVTGPNSPAASTRTPDSREGHSEAAGPLAPGSGTVSAESVHAPPPTSPDAVHTSPDEIIVTAQKQGEERLQNVPIPITVLSSDALMQFNHTRLEDYFASTPGLSFQKSDYGASLSIRGLTSGNYGNPTVGIMIDDVPYGATINPGYAPYAPDLDPGDLARIEVLRGPQGTLYGASSLGGLIRYVTTDPSTDGLSGRVQVGTSRISNGDDFGYNVRGSVNLPVSDTFAVRMSGFSREDPGYVDNLTTGQDGVNVTRAEGGRMSALWKPSDVFSLKLSALVQQIRSAGSDTVDPSLGNTFRQEVVRGVGTDERRTQAYSATMTGQLGRVELVSITGYSKDTSSILANGAPFYDFMAGSIYQTDGSTVGAVLDVKKFSQEIRATMPIGASMHWAIGAFYTHEDFGSDYNVYANDSFSGERAGSLLVINGPATYKEYAAFTTLGIDVTERFDVQVGGRLSKIDESFSSVRSGPLSPLFYGSDPSVIPPAYPTDHSFNYLLTPRFKLSPDVMVYARLASGYRPGGGNINCNAVIPCEFHADKSQNYEIGLKGTAFERKLSFDGSVYYINWKAIQISLFNPDFGVSYQDNVGRAFSKGVELSAEFRPIAGFKLSAWVDYNDAELSENLPSISLGAGGDGDRLPYSSRFSGNLSADYEFSLWDGATGFVGTSLVYVGDRKGSFQAVPSSRSTFPSYAQWNLRSGIKWDHWTLDLYANNVTDKRSIIADGGELGGTVFYYTRPRELGLSIARTW